MPGWGSVVLGFAALSVWLLGVSIFGVTGFMLLTCVWEYCGPPLAGLGALFVMGGLPGLAVGMLVFLGVARWRFELSNWTGAVLLVGSALFETAVVFWMSEDVSRWAGYGLYGIGAMVHLSAGLMVVWSAVLGDIPTDDDLPDGPDDSGGPGRRGQRPA